MPATVEDDRLPQAGRMVLVSMPRSCGGGASVGSFRVVSRDGLRVRLEGEASSAPVPAGVPVVMTVQHREHRLLGAVVGQPEAHILEVALKPLPELRQHERYPLQVGVELDLIDDPDRALLNCSAVDLSAGGVKVRVGSRVPLGALAFVVLKLPGGSPAMGVGEVLDCTIPEQETAYIVRLQFTCITQDNLHRITEFLGDRAAGPRPSTP